MTTPKRRVFVRYLDQCLNCKQVETCRDQDAFSMTPCNQFDDQTVFEGKIFYNMCCGGVRYVTGTKCPVCGST